MTSLSDDFATLRSLLNHTTRTDDQDAQLWSLIFTAHQTDPELYNAQWLPYLQGHSASLPLCFVEDLATIAAVMEIVPFGLFELDLSAHYAPTLLSALDSPLLRHVRSLNCRRMYLKCEHIAQLAECPYFEGSLTSLKLGHNAIACEGIDALAESAYLSGLRVLDLSYNNFKQDGLMALLHSSHVTRLESLDLSGNKLAATEIKLLCQSPHLSHLKSISLCENFLNAQAVAYLAQTPTLSALESLDLSKNARAFKQLKVLANDPYFDFAATGIAYESLGDDASLKMLCEKLSWQIFGTEHALAFRQHYVGNQAVRVLAQSPNLKKLKHLKLSDNVIGKPGVDALAESMPALQSLDLSDNFIDHHAMSSLREATFFRHLESLALSKNPISTLGVCTLFNTTEPLSLQHLELSGCVIECQGAEHLGTASCLSALRELNASANSIGFQGAVALIQKLSLSALNLNNNALTRTKHGGPDVPMPEFTNEPLQLSSLRLAFCELEDIDMVWFCYLSQYMSLEELFLDGNDLTENGMFMLVTTPSFESLNHLDIAWYECSAEVLRIVVDSPCLAEHILTEAREALAYLTSF